MDINTVVMSLVAVFICLACADKIAGGRFGLGGLIDEGFYTLGPLAMIMIGMITISPVVAPLSYLRRAFIHTLSYPGPLSAAFTQFS